MSDAVWSQTRVSEFPRRAGAAMPRFGPDALNSYANVRHPSLGDVCVGKDGARLARLEKCVGFSGLRFGRDGVLRYIACSRTKMKPRIAIQVSRRIGDVR